MKHQTSVPQAYVFDIERFSTEDGPGIRTTVFLKGCGLSCAWCSNPESQSFGPQVLYTRRLCASCGKCIKICPQNSISSNEKYGILTDHKSCINCDKCVDACVYDARKTVGRLINADDLMQEVLRDMQYYKTSGGGLTFSGGEPVYNSDLIAYCTKKAHQSGFTVLVETCGHVPEEKMKNIYDVDIIYFDIKHVDSAIHRQLTGCDNDLILRNLKNLCDNFLGEICVRYPLIPGLNDDEASVRDLMKLVSSLGKTSNSNRINKVNRVEILPYHRLGILKYEGLGMEYLLNDIKPVTSKEILEAKKLEFDKLGSQYGLTVAIH